jgi:hypothetical protein
MGITTVAEVLSVTTAKEVERTVKEPPEIAGKEPTPAGAALSRH